MPVAVGLFIRVLIQSVGQFAIFIGLDAVLGPLFDKAKKELSEARGLTDEEATDTIANEVIDAFAFIGITAIGIKSKLPTKLAEKLGFTSKGYSKRQISGKLPAGAVGSVAKTVSTKVGAAVVSQAEASAIITAIKATGAGARNALGFLEKRLNTVFLAMLVVGGWIDFGNWETGAYAQTMQKVIAFVTFGLLRPDEDWRKSKTASDDVFKKVFEAYQLSGAVGIQDPYKGVDVPFTRDNLLDLVDKVGATLLLSTGSASTENILEATSVMIIFSADAGANIPDYSAQSAVTSSTPSAPVVAVSRVFTGIVSQGVLGTSPVFTARPDDLIESVKELEEAASNNLSTYLASVLGKIVYEVKIVSSIITKEGFKQTGVSQQIRNGSNKDGTPKYKTVTNKFATLNVYALTEKGTRAKLTTVVLGPTNSAKLILGVNEVRALEAKLPSLVTTTKISDIVGIETDEDKASTQEENAGGTSAPAPDTAVSGQPASGGNTPIAGATVPGITATTLSGWYSARGQALPSVSVRSLFYEEFGLGQRTFYTGTAEQNAKLLEALKTQAQGSEKKTATPSAPSTGGTSKTKDKEPEPVRVLRSYTTTKGTRVTKYSDGTEKRVPKDGK